MFLGIGDYPIRDLAEDDTVSIARHVDNPRTAFAIATDEDAVGVVGFIPGQDVYRFSAGVFSSNPASARVLEKAGFVREGILRTI